jgi:hypothetical protein
MASRPGRGAGGTELPPVLHRIRDLAAWHVDVDGGDRLGGAGQRGKPERPGPGVRGQRGPAGAAARVRRRGRGPARATPGHARRRRAPLRGAGRPGRGAVRGATSDLAVRPAGVAGRVGGGVLRARPQRADGRDRPLRVLSGERARPQPAPAAQDREGRTGRPGSPDPVLGHGRGLVRFPVAELVVGGHRPVRVLQPDHLGALDAPRAGRRPLLPGRRRRLGRDHGGAGGGRDRGRPALAGPPAPPPHGDRDHRHVLLRAARHPDGPARDRTLGGRGRVRLRRRRLPLQHLLRHDPAAAGAPGDAGPD